MSVLPQMPDWDGLHPVVVHFPVALLIVAPVLLVLGLCVPRLRTGFFLAGLTLMILGCVSAFVSVSTGEAAARIADRTTKVTSLIEQHGKLAEQVKVLFTVLTGVWIIVLVSLHLLRHRVASWLPFAAVLVFLLAYLPGLLLIANMSHAGGRLVHEAGVHAIMPTEP